MKACHTFLINLLLVATIFGFPLTSIAQTAEFNPEFIISDAELQDYTSWTTTDIQRFLDSKGSYLRNYHTPDANGVVKPVSEIIRDAAHEYQINPKFLLVTLQKEQSLITDDSPTQKQLDWATGYAICDSCSMSDPKLLKYKGFGKQVDNAAGLMRWYYNNSNVSFVKKKDVPTVIDNVSYIPQSWATAFLYTYTPHIHGNKNFWRIWNTWFEQIYPDGTLFKSASSTDYFVLQNGQRRRFANQTALLTRANPKLAITISDIDLSNYPLGPEIHLANYSLVKSSTGIYLVDHETIRPFASQEVVYKLGFNPDEVINVNDSDLHGFKIGSTITAQSSAPQGIIFEITDAKNTYYLLKENTLYAIADKTLIDVNFPTLPREKRTRKDVMNYTVVYEPIPFKDGSLLQEKDSTVVYVVENGKRRRIADDETFAAMGYKRSNVNTIPLSSLASVPEGERLFLNSSLLSSKDKFLGDSKAPITDLYRSSLPAYLVAEFPSGRIVSGKDIDTPLSVDSLVQIPLAYGALADDYNLKGTTVYSAKKYSSKLSSIVYKDGEKITNKDSLFSSLIGGYGNAARMVAQADGISEADTLAALTKKLEEWGADDTLIKDVTGESAENKSTARDMLILFNRVLKNETILDALSSPKYTFKEVVNKDNRANHTIINANDIITLYPIAKRGYQILATTASENKGRVNVIMLIESKKTKKQYIIVTLGTTDKKKPYEAPHKIAEWISTGKATITAQ